VIKPRRARGGQGV